MILLWFMKYRGGINALLFSCYGVKIRIIIFRGVLSKEKQCFCVCWRKEIGPGIILL